MAIDTRNKRASAVARRGRLPWRRRFTVPIPDGTIDQGDRQHLLGLYAGIEAGEVVGPRMLCGEAWTHDAFRGEAYSTAAFNGDAVVTNAFKGLAETEECECC